MQSRIFLEVNKKVTSFAADLHEIALNELGQEVPET